MNIVSAGIDLAKNIFALHGIDQHGKAVFIKPTVARTQPDERQTRQERRRRHQ